MLGESFAGPCTRRCPTAQEVPYAQVGEGVMRGQLAEIVETKSLSPHHPYVYRGG
jgi:hypothetical protein